jgi:hypothetical protein
MRSSFVLERGCLLALSKPPASHGCETAIVTEQPRAVTGRRSNELRAEASICVAYSFLLFKEQ